MKELNIYIADKQHKVPLEEALFTMSDSWIADGNSCDQTIIDLRDACTALKVENALLLDEKIPMLPCPWKKKGESDKHILHRWSGIDGHKIYCSCGASGPLRDSVNEAIKEWNRPIL